MDICKKLYRICVLLPSKVADNANLKGKLKLEYYNSQTDFSGSIEMEQAKSMYEPIQQKGPTERSNGTGYQIATV